MMAHPGSKSVRKEEGRGEILAVSATGPDYDSWAWKGDPNLLQQESLIDHLTRGKTEQEVCEEA